MKSERLSQMSPEALKAFANDLMQVISDEDPVSGQPVAPQGMRQSAIDGFMAIYRELRRRREEREGGSIVH